MDEPKRCEWEVDEPPGYWHTHRCNRKAAFEREGHPVCGTHKNAFDRYNVGSWRPR